MHMDVLTCITRCHPWGPGSAPTTIQLDILTTYTFLRLSAWLLFILVSKKTHRYEIHCALILSSESV